MEKRPTEVAPQVYSEPLSRLDVAVTYTWHHLLSGKTGHNTVYAATEKLVRSAVDDWNAQQPEKWKYTVVEVYTPGTGET